MMNRKHIVVASIANVAIVLSLQLLILYIENPIAAIVLPIIILIALECKYKNRWLE